ncbi:MAG TPA: Gfo/Idh/MocA family oxidoreductase [Stenomitos sp.]
MIGLGLIGYGYWGPNLLRNFYEQADTTVVAVSDLRPERLAQVSSRYPTVQTTHHVEELLDDPRIDAVAIATPVSTHYDLAMQALKKGKHVFVEKPFVASTEQALRLLDEADRRNLQIMVDHTFVYTPAVRKIHELISSGRMGDIYYYDSVRVNLGLFQHDVNVIWDLAVHDLSIIDFLLPAKPVAVSATAMRHVPGEPENIAYLTLFFEGSLIAHVHVNWLAPVKVRSTLIGGSQQMIVYDDLEPSEKVKIYDKGISVANRESMYQNLVNYRLGDMWAPQIGTTEALKVEADHFISCLKEGKAPLTDGRAGMRVVRILEAATQSIQDRGRPVELNTVEVKA